jgi:hypothetical protein
MAYPATPIDTEQVFAALFALLNPLAAKTSATPFVTVSRRFKQWSQTTSTMWPAVYQFQVTQGLEGFDRGVGKQSLRAWWFVYLNPSEGDADIVSQRMNRYRDALLNVLKPTPRMGPRMTLGIPGISNVYPDGGLLMDEGLLEPPALIRIPITILTGQ